MMMNDCINYLLSVSQNVVFRYFSQQLSVHGITPAQYGVLNCLWIEGDMTPKQIGAKLYLEASSVSGVLDRMQKSGLIDRHTDPNNRRTVVVSTTEKAENMRGDIEAIVTEMNEHFLNQFTSEEQNALRSALKRVIKTDEE